MERVVATIEPWPSHPSHEIPDLPATPHSVLSALSPIHHFTPDTGLNDSDESSSDDSSDDSSEDSSTDEFDISPATTGSNNSDFSTIQLETPTNDDSSFPSTTYPTDSNTPTTTTATTTTRRTKRCSITPANYALVTVKEKDGQNHVTVPTVCLSCLICIFFVEHQLH